MALTDACCDRGSEFKDCQRNIVSGEPAPVDGESVIIPAGQTILYDLAGPQSPRLRLLLVEGKLEFLDDHDLELHAEWIMVRGAGSAFTVGRETAPFMHSAKITLHGRRSTAREIPSYGAKNIAVRYGTLDLHGRPKTPTWTRLGITAEAGTSTVQLAEPVNWQVGDEIAIASSAWDPSEVEQRRILSVSKNGLILTLDKPLSHEHWGDLVVCFWLQPTAMLPSGFILLTCQLCSSPFTVHSMHRPQVSSSNFAGHGQSHC